MATPPIEPHAPINENDSHLQPPNPIPYSIVNNKRTPLSATLPCLVFGTATFNYQYHADPFSLNTASLVHAALSRGLRAFDTSPYYGPSEELLGSALTSPSIAAQWPRSTYMVLTKVGRIGSEEFDYSPDWVRQSVDRSLKRLGTSYLDVVYCHDVEFVSSAEVIAAVRELRRLRDQEAKIRYIGISGYPLDTLCSLAELVARETGEPLDAVQSYAHFTLQNQSLGTDQGVARLRKAGVDVVTNASILGMGLLRRQGVPVGALGDFHPAPPALREAVRRASEFVDGQHRVGHDERIEDVAVRFALEQWVSAGAICGTFGDRTDQEKWGFDEQGDGNADREKFGVSVIGVSSVGELTATMRVWRSILDGLVERRSKGGDGMSVKTGEWREAQEKSLELSESVNVLAEGVKNVLGEAFGYEWKSPGEGFVNKRGKGGVDA